MKTTLSEELKKELLGYTQEQLTVSFISRTFGYSTKKESGFVVTPPRIRQSARVHLKAGEWINQKEEDTNAGIILFHKLFIEGRLESVIPNGFFNRVMDKKAFSDLLTLLSIAVRRERIHVVPDLSDFLDAYEKYSLLLVAVFSPSLTPGIIKPNAELMAEKKRMLKEHPPTTPEEMSQFEDKLVKEADALTESDPGKSIFRSGARGSFENDYKNMSLMIGPIEDPGSGNYHFVSSSYMEGLKKQDLPAAGNIIVASEYPKAIGTQNGGYQTKQFNAVYQSIMVDEPNTDCGSKQCLEVFLTKDNVRNYIDQYIQSPTGELTLLTEENAASYYGKTVAIRSPMFCLSEKLCSVCAGKRPEIIGIHNIGLTTGRVPNTFLQKRLKQRHSMKLELDLADPDHLLLD